VIQRTRERRQGSIAVKAVPVSEYPWSREKVKQRYRVAESTLTRWLTEVVKDHIPEFNYSGYQKEFDEFQVFTIRWLKSLYRRGLRTQSIVQQLENGVLLDEYQKATQNRISA
jgi:hypothetical protein